MDNINISFAPDKSADSEKRLNDIENFISLLADRIKFCLADINDDVAAKSDGEEEKKLIYQVLSDGVGEFTNADKNCEIFNDYENNVASSYYAHAEGKETTASAPYSHAEGRETVAYNMHSHAEGYKTVAGGQSSHAEGENCRATGSYSHAEGYKTIASGVSSHASGLGTVAEDDVTFAIGRWNKTSGGLFVVGNGWNSSSDESDARRSDALVLDTMGNLHIAGKLTADGGVDSSSDGGGSSGYTLPVATADTLGGVIIGDNLLVSESGIIAADLSECVKSDEIADWAKAENKPAYTAEEIGLGNVDNTADADKPISSAMQTALDGKADVSHKHTISDITDMPASLPASGGNADTLDGKHASDFAAASHKHTAADVGAAAKSHTHTKSQITDFPTLGTAAGKNIDYFAAASHKHTAADVGAAAKSHTHTKSQITDFPTLGTAAGKNIDYFAAAEHTHTVDEVGAAAEKHTHTKSDITDFPTSLPASGGNADTVDGKHANAFYPAKANFALGLDYNSLTSNGIFELLGNESNPTKNAPNGNDASNNFYVQVFVHSTAFLTQIATSVRSDKTQYIRSMSNGTWNAWGKIKSGDADTLDGKHASDFAVAGHTHTAADVGAAAKSHTHTKSQITDFPTLGTAAGKNIDYFAAAEHTHTAAEIGAATAANITAAVNAVSIGGRNIVTGSETLTIGTGKRAKGHWRTSGSSGNGEILGTFRESMPSCGEITAISIDCYTLGAEYGITQDNVPLDKDSYYTLSCWVRSGSSNNARCALQPFWKSSTDSGGRKYFVVGPSWTRLSFTSTKKPAATGNYSAGYVLAVPNDDYPEPTISVCGIKLEKGNKPTDWTPAPEDAERRITSLEARVAALEAAAVSGGEV